jgi:hypothetical protein
VAQPEAALAKSLLLVALALVVAMPAAGQEALSPLARSIETNLNRLESRPVDGADMELQSDRIQRTPRERGRAARLFEPSTLRSAQDIARSSDLGAARQDLRTLKTREPDDLSIPLLERQLDSIHRGGGSLYQPSRDPVTLYGR